MFGNLHCCFFIFVALKYVLINIYHLFILLLLLLFEGKWKSAISTILFKLKHKKQKFYT